MLRTEVWAGVQLSKLSAEVHEYEGGLEGARPCVGPQAYVVIVLIVGGGPCGLARIAIGMRQLGYGRAGRRGRELRRGCGRLWSRAYSYRLDCRGLRASLSASAC